MAKLSKRAQVMREKIEPGKFYAAEEAFSLLKELSSVKFAESVEVAVNLGVDPRKSDQVVRGATVLPNGTGKSVRVAVFTQGPNADAAREAGADVVGMEDLAEEVEAVKNAKAGQVRYRTDKGGIVHCSIGKVNFEPAALRQNLEALLADLRKLKPSAAKGIYMKKITVSSTMGPGLALDQTTIEL